MTPEREKVRDAIVRLLLEEPFWGCLLTRMRIFMTKTLIQTLGVDSVNLIVNEEFTAKTDFETFVVAMIHEACHVALKHPFRRGNRNIIIWNYACDYVVNDIIKEQHTIPGNWLYHSKYHGMSAEKVYDLLMQQSGGSGNNASKIIFDPNGTPIVRPDGMDIVFDIAASDPEAARKLEEIVDIGIEMAATMAKEAGRLPGFMQRILEARNKHVIDYRELLRDWLTKNVFLQDYSWTICDRRFSGSGFFIPGMRESDGSPNILLVVDVSGSMFSGDLDKVANEIKGVLDEFPARYHILYTDTIFQGIQILEEGDPVVLRFKGGGGTHFGKIFEYIREENTIDFEAILFFTDMATCSFGEDPGRPVLWMNTSPSGELFVPFGKMIEVK